MRKKILVSLAFIVTIGSGYAQKLAPVKGQKLETITTTKMNMEVMGQALANETVSTTNVEVKDVTADGYLFSNVIKHMTLKASGMGQDMNFDSDKKEDMEGQIGQTLKGKIGAVQEIQVDKRGRVSNISEGDSTDNKKGGISDVMNMNSELIKGQPYPLLIQLPGKAVKQGDSWTDSTGTASTFKTVTVYTLKSISADGAAVSFDGTIAKNGTVEQNGMEIQMDLTGNTKGESLFDMSTGVLKTSTSALDMKGTMAVMGQNAPLSATMTATVVVKKM